MAPNLFSKIPEPVKDFSTAVGIGLAGIAGVGILLGAASYVGIGLQGFFAPKVEQIRRNTYVQSESHVRGTIVELRKLKREYAKENSPEEKSALLSMARDQFSEVPQDYIPADLLDFQDKALTGY